MTYQQAQQAAEHFNQIMWVLISVLLVGSVIILYTYFKKEIPNSFQDVTVIIILGIGILILIYFSEIFTSANNIKTAKYEICNQLEARFDILRQGKIIEDTNKDKYSGIAMLRIGILILYVIYTYALIMAALNSTSPLNKVILWTLLLPVAIGVCTTICKILHQKDKNAQIKKDVKREVDRVHSKYYPLSPT